MSGRWRNCSASEPRAFGRRHQLDPEEVEAELERAALVDPAVVEVAAGDDRADRLQVRRALGRGEPLAGRRCRSGRPSPTLPSHHGCAGDPLDAVEAVGLLGCERIELAVGCVPAADVLADEREARADRGSGSSAAGGISRTLRVVGRAKQQRRARRRRPAAGRRRRGARRRRASGRRVACSTITRRRSVAISRAQYLKIPRCRRSARRTTPTPVALGLSRGRWQLGRRVTIAPAGGLGRRSDRSTASGSAAALVLRRPRVRSARRSR